MKTNKYTFYFLFGFSILLCNAVHAQYGYGNRGMYGGGMNNSMGSMNGMSSPRSKSAEEIEKERVKNIDKSMSKMTQDYKLDELQTVVIRKEFDTYSKNVNAVYKREISEEDKVQEIEIISERTDKNIMSFLNDEQKAKFKKSIEERKILIEKHKSGK